MIPPDSIDPELRRWWGRYERLSASPGAALGLLRMAMETDVRDVLPAVRAPTLILHRKDDSFVPIATSRVMGELIPGSRLVELDGAEHPIWLGRQEPVLAEIEEFLTGRPAAPSPDRVLATVMFVDIVESTKQAAELGDGVWRVKLDRFRHLIRRDLERFRGREIVTTGDGFLATFDGPARAIRCALAAASEVHEIDLRIRAGIHTGEIELMGDDVGGIAVHIGARVAAAAEPDEVLTSGTVRDLVAGSGLNFDDRGAHTLKGIPGEWRLYAATEATEG